MFEGEHGKLLPGDSVLLGFFSLFQLHVVTPDCRTFAVIPRKLEFFEFRADCVIKKTAPWSRNFRSESGKNLNLMAVGLRGFRKMKEVKVNCIHAKDECNIACLLDF